MATISAKKSYKASHVLVRVALKARGWQADSLKVEGTMDLTVLQARELANALIKEADQAEAKVAAKSAADARREKWRDREIAAGRIKVIGLRNFMLR
jgi:hypothetical protein